MTIYDDTVDRLARGERPESIKILDVVPARPGQREAQHLLRVARAAKGLFVPDRHEDVPARNDDADAAIYAAAARHGVSAHDIRQYLETGEVGVHVEI